jgi:hypothetical protein
MGFIQKRRLTHDSSTWVHVASWMMTNLRNDLGVPYGHMNIFYFFRHPHIPDFPWTNHFGTSSSPHLCFPKRWGEPSLWTKHFLDLDGTFWDHALILGQLYWYCACHTELYDGRRCDRFDVVSKEFSHQNIGLSQCQNRSEMTRALDSRFSRFSRFI